MSRWLKALIGSGVAWLAGGVAGFFAAHVYEVVRHGRHEPDGVDFLVGGVCLTVWVVLWIVGTIVALCWVFREPPTSRLKVEPLILPDSHPQPIGSNAGMATSSNESVLRKPWHGIVLALLVLGAIAGYSLPTVDIEGRNWFLESYTHITNIIHGAIIGAVVGICLDFALNGRPSWSTHPLSIKTIPILFLTLSVAVWAVVGYLEIVRLAAR